MVPPAFAQTPLADSKTIIIKIGAGPALQLDVLPYVAPILSLTVTYAGGDKEVTLLPKDSEWRVGYRTGGGFLDAPKSKFIGQRVDIARAGYVVASITRLLLRKHH
ncbi:hypothetical protein KAM622c_24570 [Klebsiella quasipneumoniae subsp. quasipneumoniae]|nr:hypothetical protein KAM622c_24570 [Klebsiella quasipneumoniae subsp. quasipneumoniae]